MLYYFNLLLLFSAYMLRARSVCYTTEKEDHWTGHTQEETIGQYLRSDKLSHINNKGADKRMVVIFPLLPIFALRIHQKRVY